MIKGCFTQLFICLFCVNFTISIHATSDIGLVQSYAQGFAITAKYLGLESSLKNPAGIHNRTDTESIFNLNDSYAMEIYNGFSGVKFKLTDTSSVALSMPFTYIEGIDKTAIGSNGVGYTTDTFNVMGLKPRVTYSYDVNNHTQLGISAIYLYDQLDDNTAHGYSFDVGLITTISNFNIGASIQNVLHNLFWSSNHVDRYSLQYNLGISYIILNYLEISSDISIIEETTLKNLGAHVMLTSHLDFYLGCFDLGETNQFRSGLRVSIDSTKLSYSYGHHVTLGDSHKIGIEIDF